MNRLPEPRHMRFPNAEARRRPVDPRNIRALGERDIVTEDGSTDNRKTVRLHMLSYFTVDSYGSLWTPGVLTMGIAMRLPQLAWGHIWSEPIGRALPGTYSDSENGPDLEFYLDDFEAVPRARQAYAQVKSGTIDECSIGFGWDYVARDPSDEEYAQYPGVREVMIRADLDEVSLVLRGAVDDTHAGVLRSAEGRERRTFHLGLRAPIMVDAEEAARITTEVKAGNIDLLTALQSLKDSGVPMSELQPEVETTQPQDELKVDVEDQAPVEGSEKTIEVTQLITNGDTAEVVDEKPEVVTPDGSDGEDGDSEATPDVPTEEEQPAVTEELPVPEVAAVLDEDFSDVDALLAEREVI